MSAPVNLDLLVANSDAREILIAMFEKNQAVKLLIDPESGSIVDANPAACSFYGFTREQLRSLNIADINQAGREQVFSEMSRAKAETCGRFTFTHRLASGELRKVEVNSGPITLSGRTLLFSIIHDVTDRVLAEEGLRLVQQNLEAQIRIRTQDLEQANRQLQQEIADHRRTEQALRESEERLRFAIEGSQDGAWDWIIATDEVVVNEQYESMLGYAAGELNASFAWWKKNLHPDDRDSTLAAMEAHLAGEVDGFLSEHRLRTRAGEWKWVLDQGKVVEWDASGRPVRASGSIRDITERKVAELALRQSEERFRQIAENVREVFFMLKPNGDLIYINPASERLWGRTPEQMRKVEDWLPLVDPDHRAAVQEAIQRILGGEPSEVEYRILWPDGTVKWSWSRGSPVRDAGGRVYCIVGVSEDITERVVAEQNRRSLEDRLHQAQKMEAIGQLAGGVAHDFSNLLTAIAGYSSLARATLPADHDAVRHLEAVEEAAGQAAGVTNALMTFSCRHPIQKRPLNWTQLVGKSCRLLGRLLPAAIDVDLDLADEKPAWVMGDPTQLQQVVWNLVLNARDAMPEGGRLYISMSADEEHRLARLVIRDTGIGMEPEVQERIFEPFFTTKPAGQGTGLGLAIIHGIVKDHAGHIQVRSARGEGTTMSISMPLTVPSDGPDETEPVPCATSGRGERILLAEDHRHVRRLLTTALRTMNYEVLHVRDGVELRDQIERLGNDIDLLIVDAGLPKCSGLSCLREMREIGLTTPVIVITADAARNLDEQLDEHTLMLRKPFQVTHLARLVGQVLNQRASIEESS